jgi:hypothetical protein
MTAKPMTCKNPTPKAAQPVPKKRWTNWAPGDFWLQLATVIIGIAVTFGGSELIHNRAERKRNHVGLVTVRDELQDNLDRLRFLRDRLDYEHRGAIVLRPYIDAPETIPADTLDKYLSVIAGVRTFGPDDNAFEMMKTSSQILTIGNMPIVRDLFIAYGLMIKFNERLEMYNSPKVHFQEDRSTMPHEALEATFQSRGRAFVEMVKFPTIRNFIISTAGNNPIFSAMMTDVDSLTIHIPRVIDEINREVGQ